MRELLERIYPLHRTLASDGTEEALRIVGEYMPKGYRVLGFNPGERAWTWTVPPKYVVEDAWICPMRPNEFWGTRARFFDSPLHLVSYSQSIDAELTWGQLEPHLHYVDGRSLALPWKYSYYKKDWGFCLTKADYDLLPKDCNYRAFIRAYYSMVPGAFKVGEYVVGDGPDELLVMAHIDHPNQANDDAAGVAVLVEVAKRLTERKPGAPAC